MKRSPFLLLPFVWAMSAAALAGPATNPASPSSPLLPAAGQFMEDYCIRCHNDQDLKGSLDLTDLEYKPADPANFQLWVKVHDRLAAHEMPPKTAKARPEAADLKAFVTQLATTLTKYEDNVAATQGRSTQRRLNRNEYENALRDLLAAPWLQVKDQLPEDGDAYHFNKVSSALDVSYVHMARYMSAADYALRQAISVQFTRPPTATHRYYARQSFTMRNPGDDGNPDRQKFPVLDGQAQPDVLTGKAPLTVGAADPATRDREAMGWVQSNYSTGFGSTWGLFRAPVAGRYRLTFSGYTVWVGPGGTRTPTLSFIGKTPPGGDPRQIAVLPPEWYRPNFREVSAGRRYEPIAIYAKGGTNRRIGEFDLTPEAAVHPIGEVWLAANDVIAPDATRFFRSRPTGIPDGYTNPLAQRDGMPAVAFQWMDVEGPLYDAPEAPGYQLLFGDLPVRKAAPGTAGVMIDLVVDRPLTGDDRRYGRAGGGFGRIPQPVPVAVEIVSTQPRADAERLLRNFLVHAYRHPLAEADVQLFLGLINGQMDAGRGFGEAMLAGYTAVLSSPKFITIEETPGRLDDYALATRLSLFLWNSAPDPALRDLAAAGALHRPEVLRAQTERMLDDPKAGRFVEAFLDYWLDLRRVDETSPSTTLYSDYYIDDSLEEACAGGDAALLRRPPRERRPGAQRRGFGLYLRQRPAGRPLRDPRRDGGRHAPGDPAPRQPARGPDDPGERAQDHGQRHLHLPRPPRQVGARADHGPRRASAPAHRAGGGGRHPRRGDDPPAARQAPGRPDLRGLPRQDRPAGLRPGKLRCHGRMARPLPGHGGGGRRRARLRQERLAPRFPLRPAGRRQRAAARRPDVPGHPGFQAAPPRG